MEKPDIFCETSRDYDFVTIIWFSPSYV